MATNGNIRCSRCSSNSAEWAERTWSDTYAWARCLACGALFKVEAWTLRATSQREDAA